MRIKPLAICDRCGFRYAHADLVVEWTGYFVCKKCHEDKHPQLDPKHKDFQDPKPVKNPRPDVAVDTVDNTAFDALFPHTAGRT